MPTRPIDEQVVECNTHNADERRLVPAQFEPHGDYLYTKAFIDKAVRELKTAEKFEAFTGLKPARKS